MYTLCACIYICMYVSLYSNAVYRRCNVFILEVLRAPFSERLRTPSKHAHILLYAAIDTLFRVTLGHTAE
uniref:Putative secreted peptide n=1 Tax=Anopheles braziliensis TaxID=58242 RepID=A0A2M3ZVX7_9DIPT